MTNQPMTLALLSDMIAFDPELADRLITVLEGCIEDASECDDDSPYESSLNEMIDARDVIRDIDNDWHGMSS